MLELTNLSVGYNEHPVVYAINLTFHPGRITTIIGRNGTGKSTVLKSITSLLKPLSGSISLEGKDQQEYSRKEWAKKMAFLSQNHTDSNCTVHSLVTHGRYPHLGFSRRMTKEDHLLVDNAMATMGVRGIKDKGLREISGGERQKAYLAMALAQDTPYIAFDEPATYLDLAVQKEILSMLVTLRNQGKCIIAVMHDLEAALQVSDYLCLLDNGQMVAHAKPECLVKSGLIEKVFGVECTKVAGKRGPQYLFS